MKSRTFLGLGLALAGLAILVVAVGTAQASTGDANMYASNELSGGGGVSAQPDNLQVADFSYHPTLPGTSGLPFQSSADEVDGVRRPCYPYPEADGQNRGNNSNYSPDTPDTPCPLSGLRHTPLYVGGTSQKPKNWWDFINDNEGEDADTQGDTVPSTAKNIIEDTDYLAKGGGAFVWRNGQFVKVGAVYEGGKWCPNSVLKHDGSWSNCTAKRVSTSNDLDNMVAGGIWFKNKHGDWEWVQIGYTQQTPGHVIARGVKDREQPNPMPDTLSSPDRDKSGRSIHMV